MNGNVPVVFPPFPIRDNFQPRAHLIQDVTVAKLAVVTTTVDHGYFTGMTVRIIVPPRYGMSIDQIQTKIIVLSINSFLTEIDTTNQIPFVAPVFPERFTDAQVIPMSGSFQNIAPD